MNERESIEEKVEEIEQIVAHLQDNCATTSAAFLADRKTPTDMTRSFATTVIQDARELLKHAQALLRDADFYDGTQDAEDIAFRAFAKNPDVFGREAK